MSTTTMPRLKSKYQGEIRDALKAELGLVNVMQVPRIEKIVVNMGVGRATQQPSLLEGAVADLSRITGQKPKVTKARDSIANFKRRYRDIDVLLIDDIQFMEGKEGLQEEFFHTFNSLHGANKQIVISSDRVPDAIPHLEDRLIGRFRWGLITDVQPPDLETRLAILRNKAEREGTVVPSDVLEYIASRVTSNIRELEGALIRVSAYASLNRVDMTVAQAGRLLEDLLPGAAPKQRTDEEMLHEIARLLGHSVEALRGKSRQRPLVAARQEAMYVFRELTDLSYPAIARLFGGRDHTTVIHAVEKITRLMQERSQTYDQVTMLVRSLKMG